MIALTSGRHSLSLASPLVSSGDMPASVQTLMSSIVCHSEEFSTSSLGRWIGGEGVALHIRSHDLFQYPTFFAPKTNLIVFCPVVCEMLLCVVDEHAADLNAIAPHAVAA